MRKAIQIITAVSLAASLGLSLGACSSSPSENKAAACQANTAFVEAVTGVQNSLDSSSTLAEIKAARDTVKTAYTELDKQLDKVGSDQVKALETAWKDLDDAVSGLDDNLTVPEAKVALEDSLAQVKNAQDKIESGLTC
ncbi:hypothetical protein JOF48_003168 [Arthrobacter stackebrandtii]|uniref:Uncharacterized protein n=1 Tax=Arthrobacter stackebrandtii TaxID=272161 RepID=A0ABS4Z012_9MICC|nr:hypothetical protein [Arthrobacter stackebrandtii]MBP2414369.1 hypothetical protein [Arthrobacter stackebrandtii]PYH01509.1 hypothetical protein CVV67_03240 [Arthrobacter stackebrandtii]